MSQCFGYAPASDSVFILDKGFSVPCPAGMGCCAPGDTCLSDNICHFTHTSNPTGIYSGYYISGCSDPLFQNSACSKHCTDQGYPDIIYSSDTQEWACCGATAAGNVTCNTPSNETFSAPAPENLSILSAVTSKSTTSPTTSPSSSSQSTSSSLVSSSRSSSTIPSANTTTSTAVPINEVNSKGLSTGTKAGIGVAIPVVFLLVAAALLYFFFRRRRSTRNAAPMQSDSTTHREKGDPHGMTQGATSVLEKDGRYVEIPHELGNTPIPRQELQ